MVWQQQQVVAATAAIIAVLMCSLPVEGRWGSQTKQAMKQISESAVSSGDPYDVSAHRQVRSAVIPERHPVRIDNNEIMCLSLSPDTLPLPADQDLFTFGNVTIPGWAIFYRSQHSVAFVKPKVVVPGHVLVMSLNSTAKRVLELQPAEVADLFLTSQKVQGGMELFHGVTSSMLAVQDGPDAGQTIEHVHVHIMPRRPKDFDENDGIYYELENESGKRLKFNYRTKEEMKEEADQLRRFFESL